MALVSNPHRAPEGSLLAASQEAQEDERSRRNEQHEMKRVERLGRRAYRAALRGNDPSAYLGGLKALEEMRMVNGSTGAGISMAGSARKRIDRGIANTDATLANHEARLQAMQNGLPTPQAGAASQGGAAPQGAVQAQPPSNFPGLGRQAAMQDAPAAPGQFPGLARLDAMNPRLSQPGAPAGALPENRPSLMPRQKFAEAVRNSASINAGDPAAIERARAQAQNQFGIKPDLFDGFLNRNNLLPQDQAVTLASLPPDENNLGRARQIGLQMGGSMDRISQIMQARADEGAARTAAGLQQQAAGVASAFERANADAERIRVENEAAALGLEFDPRTSRPFSSSAPQAAPISRSKLGFGESVGSDLRSIWRGHGRFGSSLWNAIVTGNESMGNTGINALDSISEAPAALAATLPGATGRYFGEKSFKEKEFNKKHKKLREKK